MKWVENIRYSMDRDCLEWQLSSTKEKKGFNGQTHKQRLGNSYIDIIRYIKIKIGMLLLKKCYSIVALKRRTVNHRFLHNFPIRKQTRSWFDRVGGAFNNYVNKMSLVGGPKNAYFCTLWVKNVHIQVGRLSRKGKIMSTLLLNAP